MFVREDEWVEKDNIYCKYENSLGRGEPRRFIKSDYRIWYVVKSGDIRDRRLRFFSQPVVQMIKFDYTLGEYMCTTLMLSESIMFFDNFLN